MRRHPAPSTAIGIIGLILSSAPLHAAQDIVSIGGTSATLSSTSIDFSSLGGPNTFDVGSASSGAFGALGGTSGTIQNVTFGSSPVSDFLTIPSLPDAQFTLSAVGPGSFSSAGCFAAPPTAGQTCTPPKSPLSFVNTPTGAVVFFSASGTVTNTNTQAQTPFSAIFSTEFTGKSFQTVLGSLATSTLSAPYSASINIPSGAFAGTLDLGQPSLASSSATLSFAPSAVTVGPTSTGAFVPLSGTSATFQNLTVGSVPVADFFKLAALPQAEFTLTGLDAGVFGGADCTEPPAAGETCTLSGSPFNFVDTPTGALMFYSAEGTATDSNTHLTTPFDGTFETEFAGETYQSLFATLANDGTVSASYSTEIAAGPFSQVQSVPEPGSLILFGLGLAGLGFARRGGAKNVSESSR